MKHPHFWIRTALALLCLMAILTLVSCTADMDVGDNTELAEQFMDHIVKNERDAAYELVKHTTSSTDFAAYWTSIRSLVEGASSYEMEQIGWHVNMSNGITTRTTAYQIYFDNDKIALFRVITRDDIEGIAGAHFSDSTDFVQTTDAFVPVAKIVLLALSGLVIAFVIWMFVDCLRRKIRHKVLWAILIFFGFSFTLTVGEQSGFNFMVGLMLQTNSITADPSTLSIVTKIIVPLGAILYFCLRKKLTIVPTEAVEPPSVEESVGDTAAITETTDTTTADKSTQPTDSNSADL